MSSAQLDMFGGSNEIPEKTRYLYVPPAFDYATCWIDCEHCGSWLGSQSSKDPKKRVFALCLHPDRSKPKVFESDAICSQVKRKNSPVIAKPAAPGWDDY